MLINLIRSINLALKVMKKKKTKTRQILCKIKKKIIVIVIEHNVKYSNQY